MVKSCCTVKAVVPIYMHACIYIMCVYIYIIYIYLVKLQYYTASTLQHLVAARCFSIAAMSDCCGAP